MSLFHSCLDHRYDHSLQRDLLLESTLLSAGISFVHVHFAVSHALCVHIRMQLVRERQQSTPRGPEAGASLSQLTLLLVLATCAPSLPSVEVVDGSCSGAGSTSSRG